MEKKYYITPEVSIYKLRSRARMLAGSIVDIVENEDPAKACSLYFDEDED